MITLPFLLLRLLVVFVVLALLGHLLGFGGDHWLLLSLAGSVALVTLSVIL